MKRDWFAVVGNAALVLSLLFVGYQIQQDRQLAAAQLQIQHWYEISSWQIANMGENPALALGKSIEDPASLTHQDVESAFWHVAAWLNFLRHERRLADLGLGVSAAEREASARYSGRAMGENPLYRTIVRAMAADDRLELEFTEAFLEGLESADPNIRPEFFRRVLTDLKRG